MEDGFRRVGKSAVSEIEKRVARLVKRAEKLGLEPPVLVKGEVTFEKTEDGHLIEYQDMKLVGELPKLNGWEFGATIQHVENDEGFTNILRTVPGVDLPAEFRTTDPGRCDHCKQHRQRRDTYVVYRGETEWHQVGSTCLADFLGHHDPLQYARYVADLLTEDDEWGGMGSGDHTAFDTVSFLAMASAVIREWGFVSKKNAWITGETATAYLVTGELFKKFRERDVTVTDADIEVADKIVEWVAELDTFDNDYLWNLKVTVGKRGLETREAGLATSAVPAYYRAIQKEIERRAERETAKISEYQGEVGKRQDWTLTLSRSMSFDGHYGTTFLFMFLDDAGNRYKWFASNPLYKENETGAQTFVEAGDKVTIKATVKAHEEYKGAKETVLTRGKFLSIDSAEWKVSG